jgi:uncharacterized protein YbjT (DUF2867 family)
MNQKTLVIGAAGLTGKHVVRLLAAEGGQSVRAMVRQEAQRSELEALGAEVVLGDLTGEFETALEGVTAVIFAAGGGMSGQHVQVDNEGAVKVIHALERHGIPRFLMISSMGTTYPERLPFIEKILIEKRKAEIVLEASSLEWTIVRPGGLNNEPAAHHITLAETITAPQMISREDVAALCVRLLHDPKSYKKTLEVVGGTTALEDAVVQVLG